MKFLETFMSKRLIAFAGVMIFALACGPLGVDPNVANNIIYTAMTYIGGQTATDMYTRGKTSLAAALADRKVAEIMKQ